MVINDIGDIFLCLLVDQPMEQAQSSASLNGVHHSHHKRKHKVSVHLYLLSSKVRF